MGKYKRDCVVRYKKCFEGKDAITLRADCASCLAKFSFECDEEGLSSRTPSNIATVAQ